MINVHRVVEELRGGGGEAAEIGLWEQTPLYLFGDLASRDIEVYTHNTM